MAFGSLLTESSTVLQYSRPNSVSSGMSDFKAKNDKNGGALGIVMEATSMPPIPEKISVGREAAYPLAFPFLSRVLR